MNYPQRLKVTRTSPGEPDGLGGTAPGETTTVLDGRADVQDGGQEVKVSGGMVTEEGDATAFLEGGAADAQVGDDALITWADGAEQEATVARVVRLDDKLVLSYS